MRIAITGVAGFIGSTTAELLVTCGHEVVGFDSFTDYYDRSLKERNLRALDTSAAFTLHELDVANDLIDETLDGVDAIVHLAAQPGVRRSWSEFDNYVEANVLATKTILDAAVRHRIKRVVYASSSSVYGNASIYPTCESHPTSPQSPYAVTKHAGEQLCTMYASERGLHTVSLRYFTVYGPRQRPDMLTQRLIAAAESGATVSIFGTGEQVRDFTYVTDVAHANHLALTSDAAPGSVYNISGGSSIPVNQMIAAVEHATNRKVHIEHRPKASGDVARTGGDHSKAADDLGWTPSVHLVNGISAHVDFYRSTTREHAKALH